MQYIFSEITVVQCEVIVSPDFVNASPKLRFTVRKVEKWLDCEVLSVKKSVLVK